jgi:2-dehydro-3-deoxygluconokinase
VGGAALVAIGEALYELNREPDGRYLPGFGGDTLNVAIAAARLGVSTAYVTRLGADLFGDELLALMQREQVDASGVAMDAEAPTGLYFVTHGPQGHVFTYRRKGSAASLMTPSSLNAGQLREARFLHASGISLAISDSAASTVFEAIAIARAAGTQVSFDTNFRPRLWTPGEAWPLIAQAAAQADILKTSVEDCEGLMRLGDPRQIAARFLALGARVVIVTMGPEGAVLATPQGLEHVPGQRVAAVDATGAGDAFTGALIVERLRGMPLAESVRFANAAAALSTLGRGAIAPLPAREAVERALAKGGAAD